MQRRKHRSIQPLRTSAGSDFTQPISEEELEKRKKEMNRLVDEALKPGSEVLAFLSVTTISEMGDFLEYIFGLMEKPDRNERIERLLNKITDHISEATPGAVITALRSTYYHRDQYKSSWVRLLKSAKANFGERENVDVDSLLTGLHA